MSINPSLVAPLPLLCCCQLRHRSKDSGTGGDWAVRVAARRVRGGPRKRISLVMYIGDEAPPTWPPWKVMPGWSAGRGRCGLFEGRWTWFRRAGQGQQGQQQGQQDCKHCCAADASGVVKGHDPQVISIVASGGMLFVTPSPCCGCPPCVSVAQRLQRVTRVTCRMV